MFAPVCVRFRGYGVALSAQAKAYLDAMYALPSMREWLAAGIAEPERLAKYEAIRG
jgi:glutathione S-transferase